MRLFKMILTAIICITALVLFAVAAYQAQYQHAAVVAGITLISGIMFFEALLRR